MVKITLGVEDGAARERGSWERGSWERGSWERGSWERGSWERSFHTAAGSPGLGESGVLTLLAGQAGIASTATPRLSACWRSPSGSSGAATAGMVSLAGGPGENPGPAQCPFQVVLVGAQGCFYDGMCRWFPASQDDVGGGQVVEFLLGDQPVFHGFGHGVVEGRACDSPGAEDAMLARFRFPGSSLG